MIRQKPQTSTDLSSHQSYQALLERLKGGRSAPPPARGFFSPPSQPQLLEKLEHLSRYSQLVLIVTGVAGVGKSTLLKAFYPHEQDGSVHPCCIRAEERMGVSDLLGELAEQLDLDLLPTASDEDKLAALYDHAELLRDLGRLFLIVVDDAERLSPDALDLLVNLLPQTEDPEAAPHLVLFGTPRLSELLAEPRFQWLQSGGGHQIRLEPFEFEDTLAYLRYRLGGEFEALSPRQLKQIHHGSFGLPGRINKLLGQVRSGAPPRSRSSWSGVSLRLPRLHLWLALGVTLVVGLGFGLLTLMEAGEALEPARERVKLTLPAAEPARVGAAEPAPVLTLSEKLAREERRLKAQAQAAGGAPGASSEVDGDLAVAPLSRAEPRAPAASPEWDASGTLVLDSPPPPPAKTLAGSPASAQTGAAAETAPTAEVDRAPSGSARHPLRRDSALLRWARSDYTLQMLGARHAESAIEFIQGQAQSDDFYYFATLYKGKPWHVVVYGRYASREEALAAVPRLPAGLQKLKPWARSLGGVQADIRRQK